MKNKIIGGFTLVELLVVLAIISIIAGIGLASMSGAREENEVRSTVYKFMALLNEGRRAAINNRLRVQFRFAPKSMEWCVGTCYGTTDLPRSMRLNLNDVSIKSYAREADIKPDPPSTMFNMTNSYKHFYIEPDGTLIGYTTDTVPRGITLYFEHDNDSTNRFRAAVLPLLGKAKLYRD
ncbi:MAG: pilus assembly FimT family protein [Myxococcota bacterium]